MSDDSKNPVTTSVTLGMQVAIELVSRDGETERLTLTLVPDEQADFTAGFLGAGTPLAKTLLGQTVGTELPYPIADMRAVRILAVSASGPAPAEDVAARREATIREAVSKSEFINAMIFASAMGTKWGDYDTDGLDPTTWTTKK